MAKAIMITQKGHLIKVLRGVFEEKGTGIVNIL